MIFEKIGITRKFFFDIAFLEKARCSNDDTRTQLNGINVEHEKGKVFMVATDGRFMNIIEYEKKDAPDIEDGFYIVKKCAKDMIILEKSENESTFPRWRMVIPEQNILVAENIGDSGKTKTSDYSFYELIYMLNNLGSYVCHEYIKPIGILGVTWDIYLNPHKINSAVMLKNHTKNIFSNGKYTTVIMPLHNTFHAVILNALTLLDETLHSVNTDKENVLFAGTIYRKKKLLFEM